MDSTPPTSPDNQTPGCTCNAGNKICIAAIACAVLALALSVTQAGLLIGIILTLAAIILSIIAIVKGSKAFGITLLVLSLIVVGPASCGIAIYNNDNTRQFISTLENNEELINEIAEARAAGDTEKADKLQKKLNEKIVIDFNKKPQKNEDTK